MSAPGSGSCPTSHPSHTAARGPQADFPKPVDPCPRQAEPAPMVPVTNPRRHGPESRGERAALRVAQAARQLSYQELAFHLEDSVSFRAFARLPHAWSPQKSVVHKTISAIRAETWEPINRALLTSARQEKLESGHMVRLDSTVTAALVWAKSCKPALPGVASQLGVRETGNGSWEPPLFVCAAAEGPPRGHGQPIDTSHGRSALWPTADTPD